MTKKKGKAVKRKSQPLDVTPDPEWISGDEEELSSRLTMSTMVALIATLNSRIDGFERRQDHLEGAAASCIVDSAPQGPSTGQIPEVEAAPPCC